VAATPPITYDSGSQTVGVTVGAAAGTVAAGDDSRIAGALQKSVVTTKGDLLVGTGAGTVTRHALGSDGQVLTADSAQSDGVKWATPAASSSAGGIDPFLLMGA